ncbi:ABC transporter ATP-binding protein [Neomoorella mulderi]|uniref:Putative HMP/thiamine import ATP-binding protein YkoD n=1 Tax=Moorella mulderi DSM 14980 TaxID=1122241 RepID=A0A151B1V5_9FIRM|nr:energy-coupling factor transporter ATPase [Moorella mulderi]KYH33909.1 putative HMP/thiamine import ATP-binding protein YkoD [Moorella mulderi DSM 14980]
MAILEAKNLSYRFRPGSPQVIKSISLTINEGEVVGIFGRSGSGKSVFGYILSGIIPNFYRNGIIEGELKIAGTNAFQVKDASNVLVGMVMQNPETQLFGFRVEDTLAFGMENLGLSREEMGKRIERVSKQLQIEHLLNRFTGELSGGQKQLCCLASILAMEPKVLVLDEPVSALDPGGVLLIQEAVARLKREGRTIIVIGNNAGWVAPLLDRVVVMNQGEIVLDNQAEEFFADKNKVIASGITTTQVNELYHTLVEKGYRLPVFVSYAEAKRYLWEKNIIRKNTTLRTRSVNYNNAIKENPKAPSLISIRELSFMYGQFKALEGINVDLQGGRIIGLIGQNGSGKSTLLKHLNGLLKPTRGTIEVNGKRPDQETIAAMAKIIGFVFQNPDQMLFEETVYDEATFGIRAIYRQVSPEQKETVEKLLAEFGLLEYREELPVNLSAGQKRWLMIASAVAVNPAVLVLDEPTNGMDRFDKEKLAMLIKEWKNAGRTIIIVSHDLPFLADLVDTVLLLDKGRVKACGTIREIFSQREIFAEINIPLPEITMLGLEAGAPAILNVDEFIDSCLTNATEREEMGCAVS